MTEEELEDQRCIDDDYNVNRVVSIVDRNEGASEMFAKENIELRSLVTIEDLDY